jgi:hypothetical protein
MLLQAKLLYGILSFLFSFVQNGVQVGVSQCDYTQKDLAVPSVSRLFVATVLESQHIMILVGHRVVA